ncbi:ABC transporter permease [Streptomyces sp. NBC_01304]|uniref:ABC transporter permease n=1 Tax=Streptomyces sp. NBC_01304 TaxID=2903818 RepID=UPI002E0FC115|nr:ABC transporter permease [Streptomyces sp. NBC_01304]
MSTTAVLHSEWIKLKSLRATAGSLICVFAVTLAITVLATATIGQEEADNADFEAVFSAFYALNFGQIAAISFGATALSSEYLNGALRISLAAVPDRTLFYAAKMAVVGALALVVGLVTSFATFLAGQAFMGEYAIGLGDPGALRACVGAGVYLALMALFAAGLTTVLRSGVAVLSTLIPFILIVSFVVGDVAGGVADYFPDRAGQQILHQDPVGSLGPWTGLAVTAAWTAAALLAGWWSLRRRDA